MKTGISWLDVKLGARMLAKNWALTLVGGVGMATAIAIGSGFFAYSYGYLSPASLPLAEGDRVVGIESWDARANRKELRVIHAFVTWRQELSSVNEVSAFRAAEHNLVVPGAPAELVRVAEMTASGFGVARVPPLLGRHLVPEDERAGAPPVAVIGHGEWRKRFDGDRAVVGREIRLGSVPHTVVGVMPEGFAFPLNYGIWTPLRANPADHAWREGPDLTVFARLAPGATAKQAQAELAAVERRTGAAFPESQERLRLVPFTRLFFNEATWELHLMQLMVSMLLVVISANVATLVYARTASRRGEITVRTALGASRMRIVAQLFVEALVLSAGAAVVGLAVSRAALGRVFATLAEWGGGLPFWVRPGLSPGTVAYTVGLALAGAVIVGVVPALQATGRRLQLGGGTRMEMGRTWTVLIVTQVALAVGALPVAFFPARESLRAATAEPGFAAGEFLTARLEMDAASAPSGRELAARFADRRAELVRRLRAEPGVSHATLAAHLPGHEPSARVVVDGASARTASAPQVRPNRVDAGFFESFGVPLRAGRRFEPGDFGAAAAPVVVNQSFVREMLGDGSALGRRIRYAGAGDAEPARAYEIVGVVGDFPNPMGAQRVQARLYHPLAPEGLHSAALAVRVRGAQTAPVARRLREIATALDPALQTREIRTLHEALSAEQGFWRLTALGITAVALSVLLLSAAGIYALLSFAVTQRRREIGIRSALGAHPRQLVQAIFSRAMIQLGMGLAVGVVAAAIVLRVVRPAGGEMVLAVLGVCALMSVVGLLAAVGPARRGLRIAPSEALKTDA